MLRPKHHFPTRFSITEARNSPDLPHFSNRRVKL